MACQELCSGVSWDFWVRPLLAWVLELSVREATQADYAPIVYWDPSGHWREANWRLAPGLQALCPREGH